MILETIPRFQVIATGKSVERDGPEPPEPQDLPKAVLRKSDLVGKVRITKTDGEGIPEIRHLTRNLPLKVKRYRHPRSNHHPVLRYMFQDIVGDDSAKLLSWNLR